MQRVIAGSAVSVSELKKNPSLVMRGAEGAPVAILNHSRVMGYVVPAAVFEELTDRLEDYELNAIADSRRDEAIEKVDLDAL